MTSAIEIADALGRPRPTDEQRAVIEAPLEPALVVAGAGSGKTETMAGRVLWLLANRAVNPAEILGLTFTRKAAGELQGRIRERIGELAAAGLTGENDDPFEAPTIATYNSYANALYRDNAVVLGREGDGAVLGEAGAWQLARETVRRSADARLADLGKDLDTLTRAVLAVSRAIAENAIDEPEAVRAYAARFAALTELPPGGRGAYADVEHWAETVGGLDVLIDLAGEYERAKAARGLVEYSDQVALALRIVRQRPQVAAAERERFRVVLLDEYQDTSVVQTWLLAELFGGHPVMAVGDPNQSIYGWRGASASNLDDFARAFQARARYSLSTSWRNGRRILDAANALVAPLNGRVAVDRLEPAPTASELPVDLAFPETVTEEADAAADVAAAATGPRHPVGGRAAAHPQDPGRSSSTRCAGAASRSTCSASAVCWPNRRSPTSCAPCASCTTPRRGSSCCACSRDRAGGSACATCTPSAGSRPGCATGTTRSSPTTTTCATRCAPRSPRARQARSSTPSTSSRPRSPGTRGSPTSPRWASSGSATQARPSRDCVGAADSTCPTSSRSCCRSCALTSRSPRTSSVLWGLRRSTRSSTR